MSAHAKIPFNPLPNIQRCKASNGSQHTRRERQRNRRSFAALRSQDDRRRLPHAKKRVPLGHSTNDPAELPARSPSAKCPAPAAASTNSNSSLPPSKAISRADRCADAPATCGSCARRRGGDDVVESSNRHSFLPSCAFLPSCKREIGLNCVPRCELRRAPMLETGRRGSSTYQGGAPLVSLHPDRPRCVALAARVSA